MKNLWIYLTIAVIAAACNTEEQTTESDTSEMSQEEKDELLKLRNENKALEMQLSKKDSSLNQVVSVLNDIEENVAAINLKGDEIRLRSNDIELAEDNKQWIIQEIQNMNYLREQNQKKIRNLRDELKSSNMKVSELEIFIERLVKQISAQENEIANLREQLATLDQEYTELFDVYQEQTELALEVMKELNEAYYCVGSFKELEDNEVVVKEGGFIGIGRSRKLKGDLNKDYFTKIDIFKKKEFEVMAKKINIITDHPSSSYKTVETDNSIVVQVIEPKEFWKITKFLVIEVVR